MVWVTAGVVFIGGSALLDAMVRLWRRACQWTEGIKEGMRLRGYAVDDEVIGVANGDAGFTACLVEAAEVQGRVTAHGRISAAQNPADWSRNLMYMLHGEGRCL